MEWKAKEEKENVSRYVKASGVRRTGDSWKNYYYCSRSGFYRPKGFKKHALKSQGSSKINNTCPSYMCAVATFDGQNTTTIEVEYVSTHVGHKPELGHLTLNKTDRELLASKIAQGTDLNSILHSIRSAHDGRLQRIHLTTKKDLLNIKKASAKFNEKKSTDRSVETWVEQMKNMITEDTATEIPDAHHIVLYYDEQGNVVQTEIDANVTVETVTEQVDSSSDVIPLEGEKEVIERLRLQLLKDAEMAVKKIKQADTLGQLVGMQKVFATVNPSLDSLIKKCAS